MMMLVFSHVVVALTGIGVGTAAMFRSSLQLIRYTHYLTGLTIASGSLLIVLKPSHLLEGCLMGLLYLAAVTTLTVITHYRLNVASVHEKN